MSNDVVFGRIPNLAGGAMPDASSFGTPRYKRFLLRVRWSQLCNVKALPRPVTTATVPLVRRTQTQRRRRRGRR